MALTDINYSERVRAAHLNLYTLAEADAEGASRTEVVIPSNPTFNCYSIAKAYTVLAVGMAYDRGLIDTDTRVIDVLGKYFPASYDEKWNRVTLHHLMTHRVGFGCGLLDIDAQDATQWKTTDYLAIVLSTPLPFEPGTHFQYTDASFYVVSRMISEVTGMSVLDLLRPVLFDVMKYAEVAWSTCPQGYPMGATGIYLRTHDMVKLGVLWLRDGDWFGHRVVSRKFVRLTEERGYEFNPMTGDGKWIGKGGMRGQMLTYNREKGLAVAWNAYEGRVPFDAIIKE